MHLHIRDQIALLPLGHRIEEPRESPLRQCLEALVGEDVSERVLASVGPHGLRSLSATELEEACGISKQEAALLVATRNLGELLRGREIRVSCADGIVCQLPPGLTSLDTEVLLAVALDARLAVRGTLLLSKGGAIGLSVTPREIFAPLIRVGATACVLIHNHPSGSPAPSEEDRVFTRRVVEAGRVVGIEVLDHIIVAADGSCSLRDLGCLGGAS